MCKLNIFLIQILPLDFAKNFVNQRQSSMLTVLQIMCRKIAPCTSCLLGSTAAAVVQCCHIASTTAKYVWGAATPISVSQFLQGAENSRLLDRQVPLCFGLLPATTLWLLPTIRTLHCMTLMYCSKAGFATEQ